MPAPKRRVVSQKIKPLERVRVFNDEVVKPIRVVNNHNAPKYDIVGGFSMVGKEMVVIKDSSGVPVPFKSIGKLVWK